MDDDCGYDLADAMLDAWMDFLKRNPAVVHAGITAEKLSIPFDGTAPHGQNITAGSISGKEIVEASICAPKLTCAQFDQKEI